MRFIIIKRTAVFMVIFLAVLGAAITLPVAQVSKLSPETREYWKDSKDIVWQVPLDQKMIALTFDDGPSQTFTPEILDILRKNKVKATFFVIAREAEKYPKIVRQVVSDGNEIANHTYSHKYLYRLSKEEIKNEMLSAEKVIIEITGIKPKLFRPPGGYFNKDIVTAARELGYKVIIWSWEQQSGDWRNPGTQVIIQKVLENAGSGNIVVFHDRGGNRIQTVRALQPIIDGLKQKGFKIVTVSEMLQNV